MSTEGEPLSGPVSFTEDEKRILGEMISMYQDGLEMARNDTSSDLSIKDIDQLLELCGSLGDAERILTGIQEKLGGG